MEAKLFVGNLSNNITKEELGKLLAQTGNVSEIELITVRSMSIPKTFAFVQMGSKQEADKAIEKLNGINVNGRTIKVNLARPREKRPEGKSWYNDPPPPANRKSARRGAK